MKTAASPAMRYHGGKFRLAPWLLRHFPAHTCYVESYGGAAGVLIQKPRSYAEVYNDVDGDIVNFFRVVRDPTTRAALVEACQFTPYARAEFAMAYEHTDEPVERARRTCVRAAMGFGSAGATKGHTGFRTDTRRTYGTAQHLWAAYPQTLRAVGEHFEGVLIEQRPALQVMQAHDGEDTLHLIDPPYLPSTRHRGARGTNRRAYRHEMSEAEHEALLAAAVELQGMVVLCGYPSEIYETRLKSWRRLTTIARISGGRGTSLRNEVMWLNPACQQALEAKQYHMNSIFEAPIERPLLRDEDHP